MGTPTFTRDTLAPNSKGKRVKVSLANIDLSNTEGTARPGPLMDGWIRELATARKNTGRLDPVLLWRNPDKPNGTLRILDGRHRIAAYRSAKVTQSIPAVVLSCPWREALLISGSEHSRGKMPLSAQERTDFAWRLTREEGMSFSKAEIAKATGSGARTVARMRSRLKALQMAGREGDITGQWWRDRNDRDEDPVGDDVTEAERRAMTVEAMRAIRDLFDWRDGTAWKRDASVVDEAIVQALGEHRIRQIAEHIFGGPEERAEWFAVPTAEGPEYDPHKSTVLEF